MADNRTALFNLSNKKNLLRLLTHVGALLPLLLLLWDFSQNQLGIEPIREMTLRTGKAALVLLVLSLAITPLNILFGWKRLIPLRKPLGLYGFMYVTLHLLIFVWIDYGFNWTFIIQDGLLMQRYIIAGFAAFLILLPLALTSNRRAQRRLGKRWKKLHRLVYLAVILGVIHFIWLVKGVFQEPVTYAVIVAVLLLLRLSPIKQRALQVQRDVRKRWQRRKTAVSFFASSATD